MSHSRAIALLLLVVSPSTRPAALAEENVEVLVVFVSRTGHTETLARAVADGLRGVDGIEVELRASTEVEDEHLRDASGLVLGTPVHWSSASAEAHAFLERVGAALVRAGELGPGSEHRPRTGGAFVTGGGVASGKELARLDVLAALLNMRFVIVGGEERDGFGTLGAQATTGPADPGVGENELAEARAFGRRFGELTRALVR